MMPSHMVANGGSELRRDSTAATPLDTFLAQQHINANTLPKWRVRDGYCPAYCDLMQAFHRWLRRNGLTLKYLRNPPPFPSSAYNAKAQDSYSPYSAVEDDEALNVYHNWQVDGTRAYNVLEPALIINGHYADMDLAHLDEMRKGDLADIVSLLNWLDKFASLEGLKPQTRLIDLVNRTKFKDNVTIKQLESGLFRLSKRWLLITHNAAKDPYHFWMQVLQALPTVPQGCHIVNLRTWLASKVEDSATLKPTS